MGFDLVARSSSAPEPGFHATGFAWRPIWAYCVDTHNDIAERAHPTHGAEAGFWNGSGGLSDADAKELAQAILLDFEHGLVDFYAKQRAELIANLPREVCEICDGTGIRTDLVGVQYGYHDRALDKDVAEAVGREFGYCNACKGYGERDHPINSYPFKPEHLRRFAEFALHSGGFDIH